MYIVTTLLSIGITFCVAYLAQYLYWRWHMVDAAEYDLWKQAHMYIRNNRLTVPEECIDGNPYITKRGCFPDENGNLVPLYFVRNIKKYPNEMTIRWLIFGSVCFLGALIVPPLITTCH